MAHSTARTLLVAALLVTAGCQGLSGTQRPPSDQRAVDALERAQKAALNVTSYRFSIDGRVRMRDDSRTRSVEIGGAGVVNVDRQRANSTVDFGGDTRVGQQGTRRAYLQGYTLDTECSRMGWARYNLTESNRWLNYTSLGRQLAVLDRTNVYWNGTETVDGVETAVVTARPTEQQLQQSRSPLPGNVGTEGGANFQNATVRVWIDTETDRVREVRREIHVRGDGATAVATTTLRFSEYGDPTIITRPAFEESGFEWEGDCPGT
jgi:hypothetical protein